MTISELSKQLGITADVSSIANKEVEDIVYVTRYYRKNKIVFCFYGDVKAGVKGKLNDNAWGNPADQIECFSMCAYFGPGVAIPFNEKDMDTLFAYLSNKFVYLPMVKMALNPQNISSFKCDKGSDENFIQMHEDMDYDVEDLNSECGTNCDSIDEIFESCVYPYFIVKDKDEQDVLVYALFDEYDLTYGQSFDVDEINECYEEQCANLN